MTSKERNAVLEEAAQWHDMRMRQIDKAAEKAKLSSAINRLNATAQMHEESAIAIRALKEPKVAFEELSDEAWGDSWDATFADALKEQEPTT